MKPRFEPDVDSGLRLPPSIRLIDPEAYDASEQRFAASVEEESAPPRFVLDAPQESSGTVKTGGSSPSDGAKNIYADEPCKPPAPADNSTVITEMGLEISVPPPTLQAEPQDSGSWRHEVAARVTNYRSRRRPRVPRYPSLQLKFDPPESSQNAYATSPSSAPRTTSRLAVAMQEALGAREEQAIPHGNADADAANEVETGARIIEFPRSAAPPAFLDELAEPVVDRPRILEVPEPRLPPPALGGISIEPVEEPAQERRPGFELPLQAAPLSKRLLAGAVDSLLMIAAFAAFAYIFFRITAIIPSLREAAGISVSLIALFWITYQYFLLVHAGTTPGLRLAHLQLSRFDGSAVPRRIRRWRVFASVLSGFSLGLGYAWCFLDEDRLCWHDRITRTYMAPEPSKPESPSSG
jgi:uncharacterized RDD family membrane protein YckC